MACKYLLNINRNKYTFDSELELDKFIKKNYGNLMYYNKYGDAVFDESSNIQSSIYNKLLALNSEVRQSTFNDITQENEVVTPKKLGVTKAIMEWRKPDGSPAVPEFRVEDYRKNQLNLLTKQGMSEAEALEEIDRDIKNWEHLAKIGDKVHKVAELYFKGMDLNTICNAVDLPYDTTEDLVYRFETLKDRISRGKNYKFIPELSIQTVGDDSDPIIGRLDLLAIDEQGRVEIYDFKVSTKHYDTWYSPKQLTVDYQLASYRALLANNGIGVKQASLNIVPIVISGVDYENERFDTFTMGNPINKTTESKSLDRLSYPNGYISRIVAQHIKPRANEVTINSDAYTNVSRYSEIAFGKLSKESPKEFVKRVSKYDRDTKKWYFDDYVSDRDSDGNIKRIEADTKEELEQLASEYLEKLDSKDESYYINLWKEFDYLKSYGQSLESRNKFSYFPQKVNAYLTRLFCNYIDNPGYEILELPELAEMGLYAFRDVSNNIVDIISMTNIDLTKKIKFENGSNNIFGNFGSESKFSKFKNVMVNNIGNAKLLETMLVINEMHDYFNNFKIGNIQVVNYRQGQSYPVDISKLTHNFNILTNELGIQNQFNTDILVADRIEAVKLRLVTLLSKDRTELDERASDLINNFYTNYSLDNETAKYKIQQLRNLQDIIKEAAGPRLIIKADNNYDTDPTGLSQLYAEVSRTILHYKKIYFDLDHDIEKIQVNFHDMNKTIGGEGFMFSNPEMVPEIKELTNLAELQFQKLRQYFEKHAEKSYNRALELYKSKGYSQAERWTFRDSTKAYNNMFVRDSSGKIAREFRTKNPYDMSNDLTDAERKWLKAFLWNVNRVKMGVDSTLTEAEGLKTAAVVELINSGHYFDIPLLRGNIFSQFRSKDFKSFIRDKFNEQIDLRRATEEQQKTIDSEKNEYTEMYNFLNISPTTRENYLAEKETSYWETNLELLENVYVHAHLRKTCFDTILPFINDIRHTIFLQSYDSNVNFDNLNEQIDIYLKTVIFNETSIEKSWQGLYKTVSSITGLTRRSLLAFNLNSLIREPVTGFYLLMSRAMSRTLGDNSFTPSDAAKAYGIVMGKTGNFMDNWTLVEALNYFYGMTRMDANALAYNIGTHSRGYKKIMSEGSYWATTAPDFLNRMTFIVAQMIHDGCYKAHSMKDGELVYDWTKDSRYNVFAAGDTSDPRYKEQRAAYIAHLQLFNEEGEYDPYWTPLVYNEKNPVALPAAYTVAQKRNIKSSADSLFGYMDHENAFTARHKFLGKVYFQFKSYFSSTRERFFLGGTIVNPKGEWVQKRDDNGELLYLKTVVSEDGNVELVETTEETEVKAMEWTGRFIEGMVNSTFFYFKYLFNRYAKGNRDYTMDHLEYRKKNAAQLLSDTMWTALLAMLFRLVIPDDDEENVPKFVDQMLKQGLLRSTDELIFWTPLTTVLETPVALSYLDNLRSSFRKIFDGSTSVVKEIPKNLYFVRQLNNAYDMIDPEEIE